MRMGSSQQYCLRWNNHRSNLLNVFDQLLKNEAFTDVTLACDGGVSVKCHKMVLAACSPYFQCLFTELPCRHPVVVLKDVKYTDMKAILEYMYRGEVNVAHDQLGALLKLAQALSVKGLVEENGTNDKEKDTSTASFRGQPNREEQENSSPPTIGTSSTAVASVPTSSLSPPHSTHGNGDSGISGGIYNKYPGQRLSGMWATPPTSAPMMSSYYDMSPLRRKKLQSSLMTPDTPILRTVLGQGQTQADSSQPVPLLCHPDTQERHFNGNAQEQRRNVKAEPSEDAPSPYTDTSIMDEEASPNDKKTIPPFGSQPDIQNVSSGLAAYVPQQKPEWKRYKQYTRTDILSAIEAVRTGMSALQAARKYGVPSRTLYDKVKKLGITTSRPFKRGSNGNSGASFPYNIGMFGCKQEMDDSMPPHHPGNPLLEPMFLQHALERGKEQSGPEGGTPFIKREALLALATGTHEGPDGGGGGGGSMHTSSPDDYKWGGSRGESPGSLTPSPNDDTMEDEDQVEDLSMQRKERQTSPSPAPLSSGGVIVQPLGHKITDQRESAGSPAPPE